MKKWFAVVVALLLLAACDKELSNESLAPPAPVAPPLPVGSVAGYVAAGSPIIGADVAAICQNDTTFAALGPTGSAGEFRLDGIPDAAFPCIIEVMGGNMAAYLPGGVVLRSLVVTGGSVNVNPLTDLSLSLSIKQATGEDPDVWLAGAMKVVDWNNMLGHLLDSLDTLRTALLGRGYHVPVAWSGGSFTPFSQIFVPDDNPADGTIDRLLEDLNDGMEAATPPVSYNDLLNAFINAPSSDSLPSALVESDESDADDPAVVAALKALAGSYTFASEANSIGSNPVDAMASRRGVMADISYPDCASLGITETEGEITGGIPERWQVKMVIDAASGGVELENALDNSKVVALSPEVTATATRIPISTPWHWASVHPEASYYEIDKTTTYTKPGQSGSYYYHTSITLGVIDGVIQSMRLSDGVGSECLVSFLPVSDDKLKPIKALAGNYTITRRFLGAAPDWNDLTIGTDGALTFAGTGPSLTPADIKWVKVHRINDYDSSTDFRAWALTIRANTDISGDGLIDEQDAINLFLNADGSLRDVQYMYFQDLEQQPVEVSFAEPFVLPAYDDSLATLFEGNGIIGKVGDGDVMRGITIVNPAGVMSATNDGWELFVELPVSPPDTDVSWRVAIDSPLVVDELYACNTGAGTYVEYSDFIRIIADENGRSVRSASHTTKVIGDCEFSLSQVVTDPITGSVLGVEGKFRAMAWSRTEYSFVPVVGFFRAIPNE